MRVCVWHAIDRVSDATDYRAAFEAIQNNGMRIFRLISSYFVRVCVCWGDQIINHVFGLRNIQITFFYSHVQPTRKHLFHLIAGIHSIDEIAMLSYDTHTHTHKTVVHKAQLA